MLAMTREVNIDWQPHVKQTGVTCYTCHRGKAVPANTWFKDPGPAQASRMAGNLAGQNTPAGGRARVAALRSVHAVPHG